MEGQPESVTVLKHQQHLKVQKELDDESWISSEELRTEGSSDEDITHRQNKSQKIRRKSKEKRNVSTQNTNNMAPEKCDQASSSSNQDLFNWKPKRGSVKLPNLFEDNPEECYRNFKPFTDFLPPLKLEDKNKKDEIANTLAAIDRLEKHIKENANVLQNETNERLKVEEEICQEIDNCENYFDEDASMFVNRYCCEDVSREETINDNHEYQGQNVDRQAITVKSNSKDFIRRNIKLASTAMLKLPLTDEEKQHLDEILSDIDLCDFQRTEAPPNNAETTEEINDIDINLENAFHFSKDDEKRMQEIDFQLENNFSETQHLKPVKNKTDNFWKSLILDQMLKEVDSKLDVIKKKDV